MRIYIVSSNAYLCLYNDNNLYIYLYIAIYNIIYNIRYFLKSILALN